MTIRINQSALLTISDWAHFNQVIDLMGYIHHAKISHFQSSDSGDMRLNDLARGPQKRSKQCALDNWLSIFFGNYTFSSLVYIDISNYL